MELRSIEFFLTVAEEGSMTRAAERLHISQPTVTREIQALEAELGKALFARTSRSVILTPDGLLFRETARDLYALYQKALRQRAERAELSGDIYLGAGETESFTLLAERIKAFRQAHPRVCFHIISENAEEIRDDIDKGVLDFGFIMYAAEQERYERLEFARRERWGVLTPREHPLAEREDVDAQSLRGWPLILPENRLFRERLTEWLGGEAEVAATYNLVGNALPLVRNGAGLILCLDAPLFAELGLRFVPLRPARTASPVLIWRRRRALSPAAAAFLRALGYAENESIGM